MPQKFILKNPHRKIVRPVNRVFHHLNTPVTVEPDTTVVPENKKETEVKDMNNITELKNILGDESKLPKRKVKVEKKDKGLIERTEDSTILITEDNKMMLND